MKHIFRIALILVNADRWAMGRGALLSVLVLVMGAMLLGLSGWFITATGLAGLAGIGIAFDVFRPSAGVRFLALGRAAARYGERLLTHEATLRALAAFRVTLLRGYAHSTAWQLSKLRGEGALTRIIADVDALDGVVLRLVLPAVAAVATHGFVFVALGLIIGWPVALTIAISYLFFGFVILLCLARASVAPAAEAEEAAQRLRRGIIDMIRDREALIVSGNLSAKEDHLRDTDDHARAALRHLDKAERSAGFWMSLLVAWVAMTAFVVSALLLDRGEIGPATAAVGVFVALALAEALLPLRRAVSDLGRMNGAAKRIEPQLRSEAELPAEELSTKGPLLSLRQPRLVCDFEAGDAVALTGPSGIGKSMLLLQIAGLVEGHGVTIRGKPPAEYPDAVLRRIVSMLPQRSALIAGTVRDNLSLTGSVSDAEIWKALDRVVLADDLRQRDGLDTKLGEGGAGLSGGQSRRLALARNILKNSEILLMDEPTEGLDTPTADKLLRRVRTALPDALLVAAMHAGADHPVFRRKITLST